MHATVFAERRTRVREQLGERGVMVLAAAPELRTGSDGELRYAVDPEFYYLTGHLEAEAVMVLSGVAGEPPFTLFVRPHDPDREIWTGARGGVEAARTTGGADAAYPVAELEQRLPALLSSADRLFARIRSGRPEVDEAIIRALVAGRRARPRRGHGPETLVDPGSILDGMRLIKSGPEIAALREAARITVEGFAEAARVIRPGAGEWQLEAAVDAGFRKRGASGPAFPTIAASGPNATVLHHVANDRVMQAGEAVLLDAGARHALYCCDVTRTFPVGGRFDAVRRSLYEIVLAAHGAAIAVAQPGATIGAVHDAAQSVLESGLAGLGLLGGADAAEREAQVRAFYPHRTSHWLGMDVHDVGDYVADHASRRLEPGMVFTVEPGLYVSRDCEKAPAAMRGIGIRIEDDVLITPTGHEVLTAALPTDPEGVEDLAG
jgi:Xaa-Pro aminopeptidase